VTQRALEARTVRASSNPILSDGTDYSSDPAPLVVGGKLYHDDNVVFGHALNDAVCLEKNVANYPRILITDEIQKRAAEGGGRAEEATA
jgi:hypothetical protein